MSKMPSSAGKQAERVHHLPRVLLRALVGGEEVRPVRDDRAADAAAELVAAVVLLVEVVDALAERPRVQRLVAHAA